MLEIKYLYLLVKDLKKSFLIALFLTCLNIFTTLVTIISIAPIVSFLIYGESEQINIFTLFFKKIYIFFGLNYNLYTNLSFFIFLYIFSLLTSVLTNYSLLRIKYKVSLNLILNSLNKLLSSNITILFKKDLGEINNTFNREIEKITNSFTLILRNLSNILYLAGIFIFILFIDYKIFTLILLIFICALMPLRIFKNYFEKLGKLNTETGNNITSNIMETFSFFRILKIFSIEHQQIKKIKKSFHLHQLTTIKFQVLENMFPLIFQALIVFSIYLVFVLLKNKLELTNLSMILFSFQRSMSPISQIIQNRLALLVFSASFNQLNRILDEAEKNYENENNLYFSLIKKKISIKNLQFQYNDLVVFSNLNFDFKKNYLNIIKGSSGKGKSTLIDILLGLLKPTNGEVKIDETSLFDFNLKSYRSKVGYVPQNLNFFNKTVLENITLEDNDYYDRDKMESILQISGLSQIDKVFDKGIHTIVGDMGSEISGGQKQRIAIARALYRNPEILIVDEPTSFLDRQNSLIIINTLKQISKEKLVIISSHDKELINSGNNVLSLD